MNDIISVIVPVYNEKNTILTILRKIADVDIKKEIIIIDDGSTDGTRELLAAVNEPFIKILYHQVNRGKTGAIKTGLQHAQGDIVLIQDADMEYDPDDYHLLVRPILDKKADVVYGSRLEKGGISKGGFNFFKLGRWILTAMANLLYGANITDESCCYKVFRKHVLDGINIVSEGFEFCPEVTAKILKKGYKIHEVQVSYYPRTKKEGKKITYFDGAKAVLTLLKYRFFD